MAARNMYRTEINIHEKEIVRRVRYLQGSLLPDVARFLIPFQKCLLKFDIGSYFEKSCQEVPIFSRNF